MVSGLMVKLRPRPIILVHVLVSIGVPTARDLAGAVVIGCKGVVVVCPRARTARYHLQLQIQQSLRLQVVEHRDAVQFLGIVLPADRKEGILLALERKGNSYIVLPDPPQHCRRTARRARP
jgi:hypothetical protein